MSDGLLNITLLAAASAVYRTDDGYSTTSRHKCAIGDIQVLLRDGGNSDVRADEPACELLYH